MEAKLKADIEETKKVLLKDGIHVEGEEAVKLFLSMFTLNSGYFVKAAQSYVTFKTAKVKDAKQVTPEHLTELFQILKALSEARVKAGKRPFANPKEESYFNDAMTIMITTHFLKLVLPKGSPLYDDSVRKGEDVSVSRRAVQTSETQQSTSSSQKSE